MGNFGSVPKASSNSLGTRHCVRHMWNLYIVSHHPYLPGTQLLNFLEDKSTVDRSLRLIQYQYFQNGNVGSAFKIRTEPDCFFPPAVTLSSLPVPTLYLHSLFHRQPEQTLETVSRVMSLPRHCPSSDSQSHQLQKMQKKSFGSFQHPSDRLGLPPLHLSLSLVISLTLLLLWHSLASLMVHACARQVPTSGHL